MTLFVYLSHDKATNVFFSSLRLFPEMFIYNEIKSENGSANKSLLRTNDISGTNFIVNVELGRRFLVTEKTGDQKEDYHFGTYTSDKCKVAVHQ